MNEEVMKIANVTYRLLDFFPEGDPLKSKTKEKVLAILERAALISGGQQEWIQSKKGEMAAQMLDDIRILEEYLTLAKYQGWLGDVNLLILKKEYERVKEKAHRYSAERSQKKITASAEPRIISRQSEPQRSLPHGDQYHSSRQAKILQILKEREKAQVADIIKELPGVTKRTIRRDMDDLLKKGQVIRLGEWNKVCYQIAKKETNEENPQNNDRTVVLS